MNKPDHVNDNANIKSALLYGRSYLDLHGIVYQHKKWQQKQANIENFTIQSFNKVLLVQTQ